MSYNRWGVPPLGWYIYAGRDKEKYLFVSPGCPQNCFFGKTKDGKECPHAEYLSLERAKVLRDLLTDAIKDWEREAD